MDAKEAMPSNPPHQVVIKWTELVTYYCIVAAYRGSRRSSSPGTGSPYTLPYQDPWEEDLYFRTHEINERDKALQHVLRALEIMAHSNAAYRSNGRCDRL
jgi:hypothetical protein